MSASNGQYYNAFTDMVGDDAAQGTEAWYGERVGGWNEWRDVFTNSVDTDEMSGSETVEAFQLFLQAFYPQEGVSGRDWSYIREEFYELYDIDDSDFDWEGWREAMGY